MCSWWPHGPAEPPPQPHLQLQRAAGPGVRPLPDAGLVPVSGFQQAGQHAYSVCGGETRACVCFSCFVSSPERVHLRPPGGPLRDPGSGVAVPGGRRVPAGPAGGAAADGLRRLADVSEQRRKLLHVSNPSHRPQLWRFLRLPAAAHAGLHGLLRRRWVRAQRSVWDCNLTFTTCVWCEPDRILKQKSTCGYETNKSSIFCFAEMSETLPTTSPTCGADEVNVGGVCKSKKKKKNFFLLCVLKLSLHVQPNTKTTGRWRSCGAFRNAPTASFPTPLNDLNMCSWTP